MSAISILEEKVTVTATPEEIMFSGRDASHSVFIEITWPDWGLERYECDSNIKFTVSVDELSKLLKKANKKDGFEISIKKNSLLIATSKNAYEVRSSRKMGYWS